MAVEIDTGDVRPRIGCVGLGWIGCHRMEAVVQNGAADVVCLADPNEKALGTAREHVPSATCSRSFEEIAGEDLDGVMIATPSALHSEQSLAAIDRGLAVFCQKPLARTLQETDEVVSAARKADMLLGVDFSYRHVLAVQRVRNLVQSGEIGEIYAAELIFHNAYGPDGDWFYDVQRSGGGCVIDLGIHLVDLALWTLDWPKVTGVQSRLYRDGTLLEPDPDEVEDYADVQLELGGGQTMRMATSWNLSAGQDAVIEARFYGTDGAACVRNVDGSFYDFRAERNRGTDREILVEPPDEWGGRAAVEWAERLAVDPSFDPRVEKACQVAAVIDEIYGRI